MSLFVPFMCHASKRRRSASSVKKNIRKNLCDQTREEGLCSHFMKREIVKNARRAFTYSYIVIYDKQYHDDQKKINKIK